MKFSSRGSEHILSGIWPENLLSATLRCSRLFMFPIDSGKLPTSPFLLTSKTVSFVSNPISSGKQPLRPEFIRIISLRVPAIFPIPGGRHPRRLLFARTKTETVEFPRFFGSVSLKSLLFMNRASSFLSKRSSGTSPANLLYRRSRNLSVGRQRTTEGNSPERRLLLTSSS